MNKGWIGAEPAETMPELRKRILALEAENAKLRQPAQPEAQPAPDVIEQQVTAILQETVRETNERWVAAAEKVARVREGK